MTAHCRATPRPPREHDPGIPQALERAILGALAKQPEARPALAELRAALAAVLEPRPLPRRRRVWPAGIVAGVLLALTSWAAIPGVEELDLPRWPAPPPPDFALRVARPEVRAVQAQHQPRPGFWKRMGRRLTFRR